jgi:hypothetical protein
LSANGTDSNVSSFTEFRWDRLEKTIEGFPAKQDYGLVFIVFIFLQDIDYLGYKFIALACAKTGGCRAPVSATLVFGQQQSDIDVASGIENAVSHTDRNQFPVLLIIPYSDVDMSLGV